MYSMLYTVNLGLHDCVRFLQIWSQMLMHLIRCLWLFTATFDTLITATYITGTTNNAADTLSRNQALKFLEIHSHMPAIPTPLPPSILYLVSPSMLDRTSHSFRKLFRNTYLKVQKHYYTHPLKQKPVYLTK